MGWKDFFKSLSRHNRNPKATAPPVDTSQHNLDVVPAVRELRIPTSGLRATSVHQDYYVLVFDPGFPSLVWDEPPAQLIEVDSHTSRGLHEPDLALARAPLPLRIQPAANGSIQLADFHLGNTPVVSKAVVQKLQRCQLPGLEFFPTDLRTPAGSRQSSHFALYVDQEISCLDEENAHFQSEGDGAAVVLEKIALNGDALESVELEQRLLFRLAESGREYLFHQHLVDLILDSGFSGAHFVNVEDWRLSRY